MITLLFYLAYVLVGALAGILGGLLGISGGVITIPCLVLLFKWIPVPHAILMHLSIGTSLAAMIFNSLSSTLSHQRKKNISWQTFVSLSPGILVGSFAGVIIARLLPSDLLEKIFAGFEVAVGIYFLFPSKKEPSEYHHPSFVIFSALGFFVGSLATFFGIGGGLITVPLLMALGMPIKKSVGTSAATGLTLSFLGTLFYMLLGPVGEPFTATVGAVYLPAFIVISLATFLTAPIGTKLAHELHSARLRQVFGGVIILAGILMAFP
ncbi:MAG: sulfite exporter TauE/SafE family protein [Anaerolineae bacterium]